MFWSQEQLDAALQEAIDSPPVWPGREKRLLGDLFGLSNFEVNRMRTSARVWQFPSWILSVSDIATIEPAIYIPRHRRGFAQPANRKANTPRGGRPIEVVAHDGIEADGRCDIGEQHL